MPKLAAFPKAFMQQLCKEGTMTVSEWIQLASTLDVQGLEWYAGFLEMADEKNWSRFRKEVEDTGKVIPMMCCSPDFTHPDAAFREKEIAKQKRWIDMTHTLGGSYCRVLSGQRRPELTLDEGVKLAADSIYACLPYAQERGITLIIENHYKDDFWDYPEFAQKMDVFCKLVDAVNHPNFGVNYDPSNTYLAGEDPIELLKRVSHRVVTMHASDRYLLNSGADDGLQVYIDAIECDSVRSAEEESNLIMSASAGSKSARSEIIRTYLRLVVEIAKDHARIGLPLLDLISAGNNGLMKAVDSCQMSKGVRFSKYAARLIVQEIKKALREPSSSDASQKTVPTLEQLMGLSSMTARYGENPDDETPSVNRITKEPTLDMPAPKNDFHEGLFEKKNPKKTLTPQELALLADPTTGYSKHLRHGEIGKGLNDYDAIFTELKSKGFNGWISIEDGVDGMEQLARSVEFLKKKIALHWPTSSNSR